MRKICHFIVLSGLLLTLVGCTGTTFAPVDEGWQKPSDVGGVYQAKKGETLQDIAWKFNLNVKRLAAINNLAPPYSIQKGQTIYLTADAKAQSQNANQTADSFASDENRTNSSSTLSNINNASEETGSHLSLEPVQPEGADKTAPAGVGGVTSMFGTEKPASNLTSEAQNGATAKKANWQWPINGQVVANFSDGTKGMEIKGEAGQKVEASRGGKVVYAGNGLPGYGNLVIIKHSDGLMSVYAQNRKLLVKEGEHVQAGQAIAEVGDSNKLHFEIRRDGKPVDPSSYLGN